MNLKLKDIVVLALIMLGSFPIMFLGVMIYTGSARIEFGQPKKVLEEQKKVETLRASEKSDSLAIANSKTWQAMQQEREEVAAERQKLSEDKNRLDLFAKDLENQKLALESERKKIEGLVGQSDAMDKKKTAQLSKVYAAMKPAEAAQIISTLDDGLASRILDGINDDRQKAKIISALPTEKSTRITQMLGSSRKLNN
jgi:flagellar motility protein MotE (MotC chaperone)